MMLYVHHGRPARLVTFVLKARKGKRASHALDTAWHLAKSGQLQYNDSMLGARNRTRL